jgi:hypothetical protein
MAQNQQPEIPQEMRDLAVQNIDRARVACSQLLDASRKAQEMMQAISPWNPIAVEVQERAMRFTQQNLDASFSFAGELTKAKDLKEALQIQSRHAQLQMHRYALQAQELSNIVTESAQKTKFDI